MTPTRTHLRRGRLAAVAAAAAAALILAACGGDNKSSSGGGNNGGTGGSTSGASSTDYLTIAKQKTVQAEKGTARPVNPTSRPAAKGKSVVVISSGQASISSQIPSDAAVEAAKAAGWNVKLFDAKLNPALYSPLVRQAVASGVDGIVLDAIDCQTVKSALQEAKAKGIVVIPIYAFDCDDKLAGNSGQKLFSAITNYGPAAKDIDAFTESYGADQANYIIADSNNKAKVIVIQDPEFTVLKYTYNGFVDTINKSGGSKVVSTLNITTADLAGNKLVQKIQAELLRHPEATWIKCPYTYACTLGVAPALASRAGKLKVMGGEGFKPELDLLRQGKFTAVNVISSSWTGWSSIDTMNSVFLKKPPVDSGIGWTIADKDHNVPASGEIIPSVDYKSAYKKAWGVS